MHFCENSVEKTKQRGVLDERILGGEQRGCGGTGSLAAGHQAGWGGGG